MKLNRATAPITENTTAHKVVLANSACALSGLVDGHAFDVSLFEELVGSHDVVELEDVESVWNALGYIERVFKLV